MSDSANKKELKDQALKLRNAKKVADSPDASDRDKADLKLIEQEHLAEKLKQKRSSDSDTAAHVPAGNRPATAVARELDKKLDSALEDSFPGSDPVSFVEASPVKQGDRDLPAVKATKGKHNTD